MEDMKNEMNLLGVYQYFHYAIRRYVLKLAQLQIFILIFASDRHE